MSSVREVKSSFENILTENGKSIAGLEKALTQVKKDRSGVDALYARMVDDFALSLLVPVNKNALQSLSAAVGAGTDYAAQYDQKLKASQEAEAALNALTAKHGTPDVLKHKIAAVDGKLQEAQFEMNKNVDVQSRASASLYGVNAFNKAAEAKGKPQLKAETMDYFTSSRGFGHVWRLLTDSHYRKGRSLMRPFEKRGTDIPRVQQKVVASQQAAVQSGQAVMTVQQQRQELTQPYESMQALQKNIISETALVDVLRRDIVSRLADRKKFSAAVQALGTQVSPYLVEQRAKVETFNKLEESTRQNIEALQQASSKLSVHMPKLQKAVSRGASADVKIDLKDTEQKFGALRSASDRRGAQTEKVSASVRDYRRKDTQDSSAPAAGGAASDPLDMYMMWMLFSMASSPDSPRMEGATESLSAADIGGVVGMSLETGVDGIADTFNAAGLDALDDLTRLNVYVPEIYVPDTSYSSYDSGGYDGGGFDGGGGGGD